MLLPSASIRSRVSVSINVYFLKRWKECKKTKGYTDAEGIAEKYTYAMQQ